MLSLCDHTAQISFRPLVDLMKPAITRRPPSSVKSPLSERMMRMPGNCAMMVAKPFFRSMVGAAPGVPCSSTMGQVPRLAWTSHDAARRPSRLKSAAMRATNSDGSASTDRSTMNTGMLAARASFSTGVHPSTTTGAMTIASSRSAMKRRTAANCRSTLPCASSKCRSMPRAFASACMSAVNAVRQSLSAPTCENPTVSADATVAAVSNTAAMKPTIPLIRSNSRWLAKLGTSYCWLKVICPPM